MNVDELARIRFTSGATPMDPLRRLSAAYPGVQVFAKRDDLTGLALGGNKLRKMEFLLGEAQRLGCDSVVTSGGFHSNSCTQVAAAARHLGMSPTLVKYAPNASFSPAEPDGNDLLQRLLGSEILVCAEADVPGVEQQAMANLQSNGKKPYFVKDAGSTPLGSVGYYLAVQEIADQLAANGLRASHIVHTTGSGGTQAGLVLGCSAFSPGTRVIGACAGSRGAAAQVEKVSRLVAETADFLDVRCPDLASLVDARDGFHGGGYGHIDERKVAAIRRLALDEGLFLDPVYTATSFAMLLDLLDTGYFPNGSVVVFIHTGGQAALFPYRAPIGTALNGRELAWTTPVWAAER